MNREQRLVTWITLITSKMHYLAMWGNAPHSQPILKHFSKNLEWNSASLMSLIRQVCLQAPASLKGISFLADPVQPETNYSS